MTNLSGSTVWPKEGDTRFYAMVYRDGPEGKTYAKKFQIGGLSRDKLYPLAKTEGSKLVWLHFGISAACSSPLSGVASLAGSKRSGVMVSVVA